MSNRTIAGDVKTKPGRILRMALGVASIFAGSALAIVKGTGYAIKPDPTVYPPHRFIGVSLGTVNNSGGSAGDLSVDVAVDGIWCFDQSGLTVADIGKKAFFSDDHTVTTTVGPIFAGIIRQVNSEGAWIDIEPATKLNLKLVNVCIGPIAGVAGATAKNIGYRCPVGAVAYLQKADYSYSVKPNFATSSNVQLNTISGTVRTSVLTAGTAIDVNNTGVAVDTPTALTLKAAGDASRCLAAGDRLEGAVAAVGGLTAAGDTMINAELVEVGGSND